MKKLLFGVLTAFGVALGANAAIGTNETTFETDDTTVSVQETQEGTLLLKTGDYWSVDDEEGIGVATTSKVMKYEASEGVSKGNDYGEVGSNGMTYDPGKNYLTIDADKVLLRKNTATLSAETTSYYIDTMVKFTATDLADAQMEAEIAEGEKIVVWMYQREIPEGSTEIPAPVLKVAGGFVDSITSGNSVIKKTYTAVGSYNEGTWYRLSVKAISDPFKSVSGIVSFVVCINGTPLTYVDHAIATSDISGSLKPKTEYRDFVNNLIPSRVQGADATKLAGLGFKGNGAVDNILFSAAAPCNALKDGSKVVYFEVNGTGYVTFEEAVDAALASETPATIFLADDLDFANMTAALSIDWSKVTPFEVATTVVLDLNGNTIPVLNENDGTSIDIKGGKAKKGTIKIISSTGNAIVQGLVAADNSDVIIGDADAGDQGVTYADADNGMFYNTGSTITLYKGNFVSDPTANQVAKVDDRYELVNPTSECVYYTIKQKAQPTTTSVTITLGEGIASATYKIGDATGGDIKEKETITVPNVAIGATIKVTPQAKEGYTANIVEVPVTADMTINVTATRNNYNLTITLGDGVASATYTLDGAKPVAVVSGTPVSVPYKTAVTISATAAEGYTLDANAEVDASFTMPAEAKTVSITATKDAPKTGALTVTWSNENITKVVYIVDTVETELVSGTAVDIEVGKTVTIVATVSGWNKVTGIPGAFDMTAEGKRVEIGVAAISADTDIGETTKPEDVGITGGDFASAKPAELQKVVSWAKANGVSVDAVNAMNFAAAGTKEEAYLLNCANTEDAVKAAKAEFKITSFTLVDGKLTPTLPSGYNGTVREKGTDSISGNTINWTYVTPENRGQFKFIKAVLEAVLTK